MSLTSHLDDKDSRINQFLRTRFPRTAAISSEANTKLRAATTFRPQTRSGAPYPYGNIGRAIDYRIRYSFTVTPWKKFVAATGAMMLIMDAEDKSYTGGLVKGFVARLEQTVSALQPVGRHLNIQEEVLLARYCFVLGLFEETFRTGNTPDLLYSALCERLNEGDTGLIAVQGNTEAVTLDVWSMIQEQCVTKLLAGVEDGWAEDIARMGSTFTAGYRDLVLRPAHLNPTFPGSKDVGGADADLIVDGCLIDIKASVKPEIQPKWLWQLVGYTLLDYEGEYQIRSIGFYMARQGTLITWPIEDFLLRLTGNVAVSLPALRDEFRALCHAV